LLPNSASFEVLSIFDIECNMKKVLTSVALLISLGATLPAAEAQSRNAIAAGPQQESTTFEGGSDGQSSNLASSRDVELRTTDLDAPANGKTGGSDNLVPSSGVSTVNSVLDSSPSKPAAATSVYRVGVGDILDIQLLNSPIRESTLYSVLAGGLLEYPLAGEAIRIQGLTTEEIGRILTSKIKLYEKPQIAITVREYASHSVIVTGLVRDPGTKALRREAVPLFVVLAEAQPRADAGRAVIMRPGSPTQTIDISDTAATSILIYPNDVIRLIGPLPSEPSYFYIIGQVGTPGQRDFHSGMTLTQAIFASGGLTHSAGDKAKVLRQGADGRLVTTEFNLKRIEQGKDPDPQIEAGDRIEISKSRW
jgi:protein involved in polysaccharide export with SLBB domain